MIKIDDWTGEDYETYVKGLDQRVRLHEVFPKVVIEGINPFFWSGAIPDHAREMFVKDHLFIPEIRVDCFESATICGAGIIFTQDRRVLHGQVPVGGGESQLLAPWTELDLQATADPGAFHCPLLDNTDHLPVAISIARAAPGNYHHVLIDIAPRLRVVQEAIASGEWADFAQAPILVNATTPDWAIDIFARTSGFEPERFVRMPHGRSTRVDKLLMPHPLNNFAYWVSPETHAFYADAYRWARGVSSAKFGDKIFTLRREVAMDRRRPHNVDEVARYLERRGFREIRPGEMSWADQIVAFTEARHVVAAMGSNISNMIFSPRDAGVLVLHPNDSVYSLNVGMAAAGGQSVGYVWCECFSNADRGEHVELYVDMTLLAQGVEQLLALPSS